jgi:hypothetical protein
MADYTQITDFSAKDSLSTGDPEKLILGSDVDGEFSAIATAISSKYDSTDLASQAQAEAETVNTVLMTPLRVAQWADTNGGLVGDLQALAAPAADSLFGYDLSGTALIAFGLSTGLTSSGTNILLDTSSARNADHSAISITAGTGLSGGGTIAATRTLNLSHLGIQDLSDPGADRIMFWDDGLTATGWLAVSTGLTLSGTNLTTNDSAIVHDSLSGFVANEHIDHSAVSITAGSGLTGGGTIAANRTLNVGAGTGITVNADDVALNTANTRNVDHASVTLTAGVGLSGGGTIAANRTFTLALDELTNNVGDTGAIDLDADYLAGTNGSVTEKFQAAALVTPEVQTITGLTDTLAESDFGKTNLYSNAGAVVVTLPNSLKTGFWCTLLLTGTTSLQISATTTLNTANSYDTTTQQYAPITVFHAGSNVWYAWGGLDS